MYLLTLLILGTYCSTNWCNIREDGMLVGILYFFSPLVPIFFFSLITYRMRDEVFQTWIGFAKWFVPVIILITLIIQSGSRGWGGGFSGAVSGWFDAIMIGFMYVVFIVTSIIIIIRTYLNSRLSEQGLSRSEIIKNKERRSIRIMWVALFSIGLIWFLAVYL